MADNANAGTPPGRKVLRKMESTRGNFYTLKTKIGENGIPRLTGQTDDFIDFTTDQSDPKGFIWQKFKKPKDAPTRNGNAATNAESTAVQDKPGGKLQALKEELEPKMRQQRKEGLMKRCALWEKEHADSKRAKKQSSSHSDRPSNGECNGDGHSEMPDSVANSGGIIHMNGADQESEPADGVRSHQRQPDNTDDDSEDDFLHIDTSSPDKITSLAFCNGAESAHEDQLEESMDLDQPNAKNAPNSSSTPISKCWSIFNRRKRMHSNSSGPQDESSSSITRQIPGINRSDASVDKNTSIIMARQLLAGVVSDGDSQPPTTQDILNVCSGQFLNSGHRSQVSKSGVVYSGCTTPKDGKEIRSSFDLFDDSEDNNFSNADEAKAARSPNNAVESPEDELGLFAIEKISSGRHRIYHERLISSNHESEDDSGDEGEDEDEPDSDADDADENEDLDENEEGEEIDEEEAYARDIREIRKYFDEEAELSGSDVEENEKEDGDAVDQDHYEPETGDQDELPTEDILRDQIGRMHWKQMMEEDKRQLLRYKEAYLRNDNAADYRFRWKRNGAEDDDDFGHGIAFDGEDATQDPEEPDEEWQNTLRQRAKWISKHGTAVEDALLEVQDVIGDSELFNAAKAALTRTALDGEGEPLPMPSVDASMQAQSGLPMQAILGSFHSRRESLLNRSKRVLEYLCKDGTSGTIAIRGKAPTFFANVASKNARIGEEQFQHRVPVNGIIPSAEKDRKTVRSNIGSVFDALKD